MTGLSEGVPFDELCRMQLPCLVMMLNSRIPEGGGRQSGDDTRDATQADIRAAFG